ncbi:MAG: DnaJ C-terminal domain-containing protein [Geminicoccaceae bacterium]
MKDPYSLLNVARDADPEAIKQAYRKLAKKLHPDRNLGDSGAEQRFKDITQAYNLLSDHKARRDYDRGRIDAYGQRIRRSFNKTGANGQSSNWWNSGVETLFERVIDRFGDKFGLNGVGRPSSERHSPSDDMPRGERDHRHKAGRENGKQLRQEVDFLTAVLGGKQRIETADGRTIEIDIPPATADNTLLRLKGRGPSRRKGDERGDLLVSIKVLEHPLFTRRGLDLYLDLPISLKEALLGAKVRTPTVDGAVWLAVPGKANSAQTLRLKGKGVVDRDGKRGDQYVRLMVMLPKAPSAAMAADLARLADHDDYDARAHFDPH